MKATLEPGFQKETLAILGVPSKSHARIIADNVETSERRLIAKNLKLRQRSQT
jgi:hypothetical protein